ncbi:MAG: dTDP-4-amino-4,6-dideoxygalactose transaminase [Bdellovibrionota bacterium]
MNIPFNVPLMSGSEIRYIDDALKGSTFSGDGKYNHLCENWFAENLHVSKTFLTPSCTSALEMGLILCNVGYGDEVILPSYTFTSTATSVVLHGGVPVFVDCDPNSLNINVNLIEAAITERTRVIMPVLYNGICPDMDAIEALAEKYNLKILVDAAQAIGATYKGRSACSYGHLSAVSFHETKNLHCGEGGALFVNDSSLIDRAYVVKDKGTNRKAFLAGRVDKYVWKDKGSSYLMNELSASFLYAQLEMEREVTKKRRQLWTNYHELLSPLEEKGHVQRFVENSTSVHNGHLYYILVKNESVRALLQDKMKSDNISCYFHYVPLHNSDGGKKYGRVGRSSTMEVTDSVSNRILRLPMYFLLNSVLQERVVASIDSFFR